jgi:hypothetical protein
MSRFPVPVTSFDDRKPFPPPNFPDYIACRNWIIREQHRLPMEYLGKRYQPGWISMYLLIIKQRAVPYTRTDARSISTRTMLPAIDRYAAKPSLCYSTRIEQKYRFCRLAIGPDWASNRTLNRTSHIIALSLPFTNDLESPLEVVTRVGSV